MIRRWITRRVLMNFLAWVEHTEGDGWYASVLRVKVGSYLAQEEVQHTCAT